MLPGSGINGRQCSLHRHDEVVVDQASRVLEAQTKQYDVYIEGSLEVKLPTIWTDEKQSRAEA